MGDLGTLGAVAVYAAVIGFVFVECALLVGFFLPGDTLLFAGGVVAADPARDVSLPVLLAGVLAAAIGGECVGYLAGVRFGRSGLARRAGRGSRVRTPANLARAERFAQRYGMLAIIAARWIPWVRTFAPLLAGAARMPWPRFMLANVAGAVCWGPTLLLLGYWAADIPALGHASLLVAAVVVLGSAVTGWLRWRAAARPGARPAGGTAADPTDGSAAGATDRPTTATGDADR